LDPRRACGRRIQTRNEAHNSSIQNAQAWHCATLESLADIVGPCRNLDISLSLGLSRINTLIPKWTFKEFLLKNAYTLGQGVLS